MEIIPDVAVAESSTAVSAPIEIPKDGPGYSEWRMTGKLPEKPKADSTTAKKTDSAGAPSGKSDAASEAATGKQERDDKRTTASDRVKELLDDLKRAGLTPAELKTFKRESAAAEAVKTVDAPKVVEAVSGPIKPKQEDFATYDLFETALDKWHEDVADFRAELKMAERDRKKEAEATSRATTEKLEAAGKRYGAESKQTIIDTASSIFNDAKIAPPVKALIDDSPVIADLIYTLGSKAEDLQEFLTLARTKPGEAIRKIVLMERLIAEELAKDVKTSAGDEAGRDAASGKFTAPPAKKVSGAPPPPKEAGGRSSAPPDELERASTDLDFANYSKLANARDLARAKGR